MVGKRAYRRICVNDIDRNQLVEAALAYGNTGTVMQGVNRVNRAIHIFFGSRLTESG